MREAARILALVALLLAGPALAQQQSLPQGAYVGASDVSSGVVTAAVVTATMAGVANQRNILTGFEATANNATAGCYQLTLSGVVGGPFAYFYCIPGGSAAENPLIVGYDTPLVATGLGVAISMTTTGALSAGVSAVINLHGYRIQPTVTSP
jgi:hypothetical protein